MPEEGPFLVEKIEKDLARYDHPLFLFSVQPSGSGVTLAIELREGLDFQRYYEISFHERDVESR